ncbi:hypothetical protein Glove_166g277 [Diversispora epigaea]|uniref:Uncharacterized protein n=1 Tax=Diversispora epigaea TaxID=1348612 RepID=A0A397IZS0_9GLOM|nr:hypothetical protein Glove_166g277 [Diversispora epigaea]
MNIINGAAQTLSFQQNFILGVPEITKSLTIINGKFEGPQLLLRFISYAKYSNVSLIGQGEFSKWIKEIEKQNVEMLYKIIKQNGIGAAI